MSQSAPDRPTRPPQRPPPPSSNSTAHQAPPVTAYVDSSDSDDDTYPAANDHRHPQNQQPPPGQLGAQAQQSAGALFSSLKGGAFSIMRNVKDASSKVMETVSA